MSLCPWYSLQADIYSGKFNHWITVIWKGWELDYYLKKINFSFAFCHSVLLSTALECSVRWYRAVSKGNRETLLDFSLLHMSISLQHTVTLKFKSPQELTANLTWNWGISHYLLTKVYTQLLYTPFTLSVCQNGSEQPVFTSLLLQCTHGASLGLLELHAAPSFHLLWSWERVVLSPQCTGHCVPLHTCHDSSPDLVGIVNYLMQPDSTTTHPHLHTWNLLVHSRLPKRRISHYPWAPRTM